MLYFDFVRKIFCRKYLKYLFFYPKFFKDFFTFKKSHSNRFVLKWKNRKPCLSDNTKTTSFDRHYLYHPAWAARILKQTTPDVHVDISSILYFSAILSAFIPVKYYDYRPVDVKLDNFSSEAADLINLPFRDKSIESLSCMHTVEHVGLGRYGDCLDPDGDLKAINELKRVLAPQGNLLFVVPIGRPKIVFNAHRVYSYQQIMDYFIDLKLIEFSLISKDSSNGGIILNASRNMADQESYGCGCFWFKKI